MMILLVSVIISLTFAFVIFFVYTYQLNKLKELSFKINKSVNNNEYFKVEFKNGKYLNDIANQYNNLINQLSSLKQQTHQFALIGSKNNELNEKIKNFEHALSNLNLLTDIGKQITSSLTLNSIAQKVFHYINSSMVADEVNMLIYINNEPKYFSIHGKNIELIKNENWITDDDNVLNWCNRNNKEAFLTDAENDFGQYFFKQPQMVAGNKSLSVIGMPLQLAEKKIGAIAVMSKYKNAFEVFHLDFMRTIGSYLSVAIENANLYEELDLEKHKNESLLLNILPKQTARELLETGTTKPRYLDNISVMFTDFKDFTRKSEKMPPQMLVKEIDYCFSNFDRIVKKHGVEKIKTIGDAYMCAAGLPEPNNTHAHDIVNAAIEIAKFMEDYKQHKIKNNEEFFEIRIGINSGPVVAGVVGKSKFAYDIWGDTVNVAARMESASEPGKINISETTYNMVKDSFNCKYRGKFTAKNKGDIDMYFVTT
ncbi:MAG: adenylate/guanylate cyclase domain-containing protein [Bacteroidia bacterium]